ncbi:MAG: anti-sigma regulatory factor [Symploca sp. SIO1C2]|nr:anti-sigma regulatory factor [Symploca sp. SIO1C2]
MIHEQRSQIHIRVEADTIRAIMASKQTANRLGFDNYQCQMISTAVSELVRNILKYAGSGEVIIVPLTQGRRTGLEIIVKDRGPGIADLEQAMQDDFSSSGTLGLGLPGVKRLMDEFEINSELNVGTEVVIRQWL